MARETASLLLRVGFTGEDLEEAVFGTNYVQVGLEVIGELLEDRFRFALAQQPVVDMDTREVWPKSFRKKRGNNR